MRICYSINGSFEKQRIGGDSVHLWPFVHFLSFVFYCLLAGYVLLKGFRSLLNRLCAAMLLCFAIWGFGAIAVNDNRLSLETVSFMTRIQSIGWFSFGAFGLWFALVFADRRAILRKKWLLLPLLGMPLVFLYQQWVHEAVVDTFVRQPYGWDARWSDGPWPWLYYLYYLSHMAGMIYLFLDTARRAPKRIVRTQAGILFVMSALPLALGTMTNVILPRAFDYYRLAATGDLITLFFAFGIVYVIMRYHFMAISPASAAENIIATIQDALFLLNADGRILRANDAACALLGFPEKALRGECLSSYLPAREKERATLDKMQRSEEFRNEEIAVKSGGTETPVLLTASVLRDEAGEPAGLVCTAHDITERKTAEEALSRANDELEKHNLELRTLDSMKDAFIRAVSHELKTPVAKHAMQLEVLRPMLDAHNLSEHERLAFDVMEESVRRQQRTIRNLLDLSRLESGGVQHFFDDVRLDHLVTAVVEDYRYAIEANGVKAVFDVPPLMIKCDREMLWHVFSNLVGNAIKFRGSSNPEVIISAESNAEGVLVQVADNGIGIAAENMEKLFTRFFQGTPSSEGSGVGLTICQMIVEGFGGRIWLDSEGTHRGTSAFVLIPAGSSETSIP